VDHLFHGRVDETIAAAELTATHAHGSPFEVGGAGALLSMAGAHERGQQLIDHALAVNPRLPGWIQWCTAVNHFSRGEHQRALEVSDRFSLPECPWDPIVRTVALAHVGRDEEARTTVRRARQLRPLLADHPEELIGKIVQPPDLQHDFVDCLHAAGLGGV
jgi:hypothetical protein